MRRPLPLLVLLQLGCASTPAPREAPRTPPPSAEASTPPRDPTLAENDLVRAPPVETVHGVTLSDPYRAPETDPPATQRWVAYQNARSQASTRCPLYLPSPAHERKSVAHGRTEGA